MVWAVLRSLFPFTCYGWIIFQFSHMLFLLYRYNIQGMYVYVENNSVSILGTKIRNFCKQYVFPVGDSLWLQLFWTSEIKTRSIKHNKMMSTKCLNYITVLLIFKQTSHTKCTNNLEQVDKHLIINTNAILVQKVVWSLKLRHK